MRAVSWMALAFVATTPAWAQPAPGEAAEEGAPTAEQPDEEAAPAAEQPAEQAAPAEEAPAEEAPPAPPPPPPAEEAPDEAPPVGELPAWEPAPGTEPEPGQADDGPLVADWDAAVGPAAEIAFPWVEHHGYFRLRTDLFHNLDLDTFRSPLARTSPIPPPLTERVEDEDFSRGAETLAGANIRFRYRPTLHITETLRVRLVADILDNLVLGSTPADAAFDQFEARPDVPLVTFAGGQRPPESGVTGFRDSVRVKSAWGEWKSPIALLQFGRMPDDWGLGIFANGGQCFDCNFGDYVDRIMGVTKLFDTYIALAWDFPAEGATGFAGIEDRFDQPFGQAFDLDQRDDVNQWVIALFRRPLTLEEKEERAFALDVERTWVWDWGLRTAIRNQALTSFDPDDDILPNPDPGQVVELREVEAFAFIPDVYFNFQYRPRRDHEIRLQLEAVGVWGSIDEVPSLAGRPEVECEDPTVPTLEQCPAEDRFRPRQRDIRQWGYALEFDHRIEQVQWGIHQGVASGDDTEGFGILDRTPLGAGIARRDDAVTNFKFDRDYIIDLILFRELIGGVTNAAYFKPYIAYDFIRDDREAWGFKLSALYAFALEPEATPGNERPLGLEFDADLYIVEFDTFRWSLSYGILFPFGAFNLLDDQDPDRVLAEPGVAQTIQMFLGMAF